jgi:hypothetical protein
MAGESCIAIYERQTPETSLMYRVVARQHNSSYPRIPESFLR